MPTRTWFPLTPRIVTTTSSPIMMLSPRCRVRISIGAYSPDYLIFAYRAPLEGAALPISARDAIPGWVRVRRFTPHIGEGPAQQSIPPSAEPRLRAAFSLCAVERGPAVEYARAVAKPARPIRP